MHHCNLDNFYTNLKSILAICPKQNKKQKEKNPMSQKVFGRVKALRLMSHPFHRKPSHARHHAGAGVVETIHTMNHKLSPVHVHQNQNHLIRQGFFADFSEMTSFSRRLMQSPSADHACLLGKAGSLDHTVCCTSHGLQLVCVVALGPVCHVDVGVLDVVALGPCLVLQLLDHSSHVLLQSVKAWPVIRVC